MTGGLHSDDREQLAEHGIEAAEAERQLELLRRPGRAERERALTALAQVGMADFANRQISQI